MKKILLLGGSNCQKNALIRGKELGYEMIVADYSKAPPACTSLDRHILVSTFDIEACMEAAKENQVDGIMTMGTDQPVLTGAAVAEALGLPTLITAKQAKAVTNKKIMKAILTENKIPTVEYRIIDKASNPEELKELKGPVVIKPLDSQGQRGVYKLDSLEEAMGCLDKTLSFSRQKEALLEAYYPSDEITVSGWIQDSVLYVLTVTDRILLKDDRHIGICTSHRFPTIHMDQYEEIRKIAEDIVHSFHLENGPLYIQMLIGKEGIKVNELAARIGGAFEDVIVPRVTGFSILDAVLSASIGGKTEVKCLQGFDCSKSPAKASIQLMFADPGIIESITPVEELLKLEHVLEAGYNFKVGDEIKKIEDATARFGHCVLFSDSGPIGPSLQNFREKFKIIDRKGNHLFKVFQDEKE